MKLKNFRGSYRPHEPYWPRLLNGYPGKHTDFSEVYLHGHVEQIRVSVTHTVLAEQDGDHLATSGRVRQTERFVLEVGAQTLCVHFDCFLRTKYLHYGYNS